VKVAALRVGGIAVFGVLPAFAIALVLYDLASGEAGWAFREAFLGAANAVLDGESPYPALSDPSIERGSAFVYPPVMAFLVTPFILVADDVAVILFAVLLVACVPATLAVLGVRDWRCYGLALLWPPVLSAVHVENITLLIALAAALVWRLRDHSLGAVSLGASIAVKPLLWTLGVWLLATGRLLALLWSVVVAVALVLASWAVIGFAGLGDYQTLLRELSEAMDEWGYSIYALALDLGAGDLVSRALWVAVAVASVVAVVVLARQGDERRAFIVGVAATIACSPIVWLHYFALLLVVVALAQRTLGLVWFAPLLMYASEELQNGETWQTALTIAVAALTVGLALWRAPASEGRRARDVEHDRRVAVAERAA
jgi:Glycosyltransferase family 87